MPSPRGTNHARAYIVRQRVGDARWPMAHDELDPDTFASTRSDLVDPAKSLRTGDDDPRDRLVRLLQERLNGSDQEISSLLETLEAGHGVAGVPARGKSAISTDQKLAAFLRSKGMSEDDIRTACDLGIGSSARFGGVFGSNMGGNLSSQVSQPSTNPTNPASRDRAMTYEEMSGCEPAGDSRRFGRDERMSFDAIYGMLPTIERLQRRRPMSANQMAMDAKRAANFLERFPQAARIKPAY
jgi:hypothetical protein